MKTFLFFCLIFPSLISAQSFQWQQLPNSPFRSERHEDLMFINSNTGWIIIGYGNVFRTTDGGITIDTLVDYLDLNLRSVGFLDANTGIIGTLHAPPNRLYRTTNGGYNWTLVTNIPPPVPTGICGITQIPPNTFYCVGRYQGPASVIKSTDKGETWLNMNIDTSLTSKLVDTYFFDELHGFAVGSKGGDPINSYGKAVILYTSNGGVNWEQRFLGSIENTLCWKIDFRTPLFGYVSVESFLVHPPAYIVTTDGGITWTYNSTPSSTAIVIQGIGFLNQNTGWIGGWGNPGPMYQTTNSGLNWTSLGMGNHMNRFQFVNDSTAFACGQYIYKFTLTTDIHQISDLIPKQFELEQNYPNPFNPVTKIKFSIHERSNVSLKIYNVSGKEIVTLTDKSYQPGEYETTFTGNDYPSGVYYAKLISGDHTETIKMVLMK